jgi:hypothetical protein
MKFLLIGRNRIFQVGIWRKFASKINAVDWAYQKHQELQSTAKERNLQKVYLKLKIGIISL